MPDTTPFVARIRQRFARSLDSYGSAAILQAKMARDLLDALEAQAGTGFPRLLEAGCGTGILTDLLEQELSVRELLLVDLVPECARFHRHRANAHFRAGDLETLELPKGLDLCLANAVFQWLKEPQAFLARLHDALKPGATLAFTTFGPENLREIRQLTGRGLEYPAPEQWREMLAQEGYRPLRLEQGLHTLPFPSPLDVLKHLKATGVTATGDGTPPWSRARLLEFQKQYREKFPLPDGQVSLTYHPVLAIARRLP